MFLSTFTLLSYSQPRTANSLLQGGSQKALSEPQVELAASREPGSSSPRPSASCQAEHGAEAQVRVRCDQDTAFGPALHSKRTNLLSVQNLLQPLRS